MLLGLLSLSGLSGLSGLSAAQAAVLPERPDSLENGVSLNGIFQSGQSSSGNSQSGGMLAGAGQGTTRDWRDQLPDLGASSDRLGADQRRGEQILRQVRRQFPELQDPLLLDYLNRMGRKLAFQTGHQVIRAIVLINDEQINAFATPGGVMAVNRGLIIAARNEDELASVMAHELAHIAQRHTDERERAARRSQWLSMGGMLAGLALAKESPEVAQAVTLGGQAAAYNQMLAYSRDQERDADRQGMAYLAAAGYRPQAAPDFLQVLQERTRRVGFIPSFLLTHPLTAERISEAQARVFNLPVQDIRRGRPDSGLFGWVKLRTLALSNQLTLEQLNGLDEQSRQYGTALWLQSRQRHAEALQVVRQLQQAAGKTITGNDQRLWVNLLEAELLRQQDQPAAALALLQPLERIDPQQPLLQRALALAEAKQGQVWSGLLRLQRLTTTYPTDPALWSTLYDLSRQLPAQEPIKPALSLYFRSEALWWDGASSPALDSLTQAKRLTTALPRQTRQAGEPVAVSLLRRQLSQKISQRLESMLQAEREDRRRG